LIVNVAGLILIRALFPVLSREEIGTGVHLVFWSFALFMIWRPQVRERREVESAGRLGRLYVAWLVFVSLIMLASLVLDLRTAVSWIIAG